MCVISLCVAKAQQGKGAQRYSPTGIVLEKLTVSLDFIKSNKIPEKLSNTEGDLYLAEQVETTFEMLTFNEQQKKFWRQVDPR